MTPDLSPDEIAIDKLRDEVERLRDEATNLRAERDAARADARNLRADAERWRMVRKECLVEPGRRLPDGKLITVAWWTGIDIPTNRKATDEQYLNALDKRLTDEINAGRSNHD